MKKNKRVLYLVSLESTIKNSIHKNQVLPFYEKGLVELLFLSPLFIFSRKKKGLNKGEYLNHNKINEIRLPILSFFGYMNWFILPFYLSIALPTLFFFIKKNKNYDIIHARGYNSGLLVLMYKYLINSKIKLIFDPRSTYPEEGIIIGRWGSESISYKIWKLIEKKILINSSVTCCVSNGLKHHFENIQAANYKYIPAFVDEKFKFSEDSRTTMRKKYSIKDEEPVFLYLGSIGLWHGVEELKQLIKKISTYNYNFHIFVLSNIDPKLFKDFSNVKITYLDAHKVPGFLSFCDYSFLPGKNENKFEFEILNKTMISSKIQECLVAGMKIIVNSAITEAIPFANCTKGSMIYDFNNDKLEIITHGILKDKNEISSFFLSKFSTNTLLELYKVIYDKL